MPANIMIAGMARTYSSKHWVEPEGNVTLNLNGYFINIYRGLSMLYNQRFCFKAKINFCTPSPVSGFFPGMQKFIFALKHLYKKNAAYPGRRTPYWMFNVHLFLAAKTAAAN